MTIRWFTSAADKAFKGKVRPRKDPVPPKSKKPKYKSPQHTQRIPKLLKPRVDSPSSEIPYAIGHVVHADSRDSSSIAIKELQFKLLDEDLTISKIEWKKGPGGNDDDGWCASLSGQSFASFDILFAKSYSKPKKYRNRDMRENYEADGIIGVSHPGCTCYLMVTVSDGSVYEITPEESEPKLVRAPTKAPTKPMVDEDEEPEAETPNAEEED